MTTPGAGTRGPEGLGIWAILTTVLFVGLIVLVWGFASLWTDRDVIDEQRVGPLAGPLMVAAASAAVLAGSILGTRRAFATKRIGWSSVLVWTAAAWLLFAVTGAVVVAASGVQIPGTSPISFAWRHAFDWSGLTIPVAAIAALAGSAALAARHRA